ncbi:MAG: PaaI family thioesterase [Chloroflexota bacterium]
MILQPERDDSPRHNCFGCGMRNPEGLRIEFEIDGLKASGRFTPRKVHQGFPGVAHGGIAAAAMDEAMGWAMYAAGAWAMTVKMQVKYRKPLTLGEEVIVSAETTRDRGRRLEAAARIETLAGEVLCEAEGLFLRMPESESQKMDSSSFVISG